MQYFGNQNFVSSEEAIPAEVESELKRLRLSGLVMSIRKAGT